MEPESLVEIFGGSSDDLAPVVHWAILTLSLFSRHSRSNSDWFRLVPYLDSCSPKQSDFVSAVTYGLLSYLLCLFTVPLLTPSIHTSFTPALCVFVFSSLSVWFAICCTSFISLHFHKVWNIRTSCYMSKCKKINKMSIIAVFLHDYIDGYLFWHITAFAFLTLHLTSVSNMGLAQVDRRQLVVRVFSQTSHFCVSIIFCSVLFLTCMSPSPRPHTPCLLSFCLTFSLAPDTV